jgi:hypothetical protein
MLIISGAILAAQQPTAMTCITGRLWLRLQLSMLTVHPMSGATNASLDSSAVAVALTTEQGATCRMRWSRRHYMYIGPSCSLTYLNLSHDRLKPAYSGRSKMAFAASVGEAILLQFQAYAEQAVVRTRQCFQAE